MEGVLNLESQTLIFDLDDTLVHCNKYFKNAVDEFVEQIQEWFDHLSKEEIRKRQIEIDIKSVKEHGLHSSRFPESLATTYMSFCTECDRNNEKEKLQIVKNIGKSVFQIEVQPFPDMYDVLNTLKDEGHSMYLFTGGDEPNQNRKIMQLELEEYFKNNVYIFEHKNADALRKVIEEIKITPKSTWMIGNSLRTDIQPAIDLEINAIHIPSDIEWAYNKKNLEIETEFKGKFIELKSLKDLPNYIRGHANR